MANKLLSRKFWMALSACVYFAAYRRFGEISQVVIAFLAVTAALDGYQTYVESKSSSEEPPAGD